MKKNLVRGNLELARRRLDALESGHPVVVNVTFAGVNVRVEAGGFLSGTQLRLESANSLSGVTWQVVAAQTPGVGPVVFTDSPMPSPGTSYYRLTLVP